MFKVCDDDNIACHLPKRDAIMKSESSFDSVLGQNTTEETGDDCNEADLTVASFVLETAKSGESVVRILSNDADMFVLLAYWVN